MDEAADDKMIDTPTRRGLRRDLPVALRTLYRSVLAETLAVGTPVDPTALVVVLGAHNDSCETMLKFTSDHVSELLWFGIHEFCEDRQLVMPAHCAEALHAVLTAASHTNLLSTDSDKPRQLFEALHGLHAS